MTLFDSLAAEHALFRRMFARLECAFTLPAKQARAAVREELPELVAALEGHEDLEHLMFSTADLADCALGIVMEAQRAELEHLREDAVAALRDETPDADARVKALVHTLTARLESHFLTEETMLWPKLARRNGRSLGASLERKIHARVGKLQEDLKWRRMRLEGRRPPP